MAAIVRVSVLRKSKRFLFLLLSSTLNCHRFVSSHWCLCLATGLCWSSYRGYQRIENERKRFLAQVWEGKATFVQTQAIMQYEENFAPNEISTNGDVKIPPPLLIPTRIPQYNQ